VVWIHLTHDKDLWQDLVNKAVNLQVPQKAGSFLTSRVTISFSRRALLHGLVWNIYT
jgi:hypothetical protein